MPQPRLTPAQVDKIRSIFEEACSLELAERSAYVHEESAGDPTIETELQSLLFAHDASQDFFEKLSEEVIAPALTAFESGETNAITDADRKILHYEIIERIGVGGMGVVYKARDTRLARTVALKFLPRRDEANPAAQARLLAEARAASALDHPNIGVVYDIAEAANGRQFMAMAWYDGETLRAKAKRGPVPVDEAVAIATQLASALAAAHGAGIVHRDVKPANVIITQSGAVKLLDFGIARLMDAQEGDSLSAAGTVAYMSPEQTRHEVLGAGSDIWSIGVLLYEILAAQRPFQGANEREIVAAIRTDEPAPLQVLRPDVPQSLADIVHTCLRKKADERYASADDLLAALKECDKSFAARPTRDDGSDLTTGSRPRKRWRRKATAGALFAAVLLSFWSYSAFRDRNNSRAATASASPISIAVLSFKDASSADSGSYLYNSLSDEIRTELSRHGDIVVPSYLSSSIYVDLKSALPRVRADLGSQYAIAGEMEPSAVNQVHFHLIDVRNERELWSGRFSLAPTDLAAIIPGVTTQVISALRVTSSDAEAARTKTEETSNPFAYELYLRGRSVELGALPRNVLDKPTSESIRRSQAFYAQARALDPSFALARARLAMSHLTSASVYDKSRERLEQARLEAEAALRIDSGIVDAHQALSEYWNRTGSNALAITDLERVLQKTPHNVSLIISLGLAYRLAGRFEDAIEQFHLAQKLDPRNPLPYWYAASTYGRMRRHDRGSREFNRLIAISPEDYDMRIIKGQSYLRWKGTADTLLAQAAAIPQNWDHGGMATFGRYTAFMVQRRYREGLQMLERSKSELSTDGFVYSPNALMRGDMLKGLGERSAANAEYKKAKAQLLDSIAGNPKHPAIHASLGRTYAELGNRGLAISESEKAMSLAPLATTGPLATAVMGIAVETFGIIGEKDRAFQMIELMLSMPSGREISVPFLKVWPGFDPLRSDPRFNQLLERFTIK